MIKNYLLLTKPGIIVGNVVTTLAGFMLAAKEGFSFPLFLATLLGISCIVAAACVFNNYIDRVADSKMERTKNRTLATEQISVKHAIMFASALAVAGTFLLAFFTSVVAMAVALTGLFFYVVVYSYSKYHTLYATLLGSIAGAIPPVVGYTAVTGAIDLGAFLLFLIIALWQMPHFYGIALYRLQDYKAASIPVLPAVKGAYRTKIESLLYIVCFTIASCMLTFFGFAGYGYLTVMVLLGAFWFVLGLQKFTKEDDRSWGKSMFRFSLVAVMAFSVMIPLDGNKERSETISYLQEE